MSGFKPYEGPNEIVERLRAELAAAIKQRDDVLRLYQALLDAIKEAVGPREKEGGGA